MPTVRAIHTFVAEHGDELEFQAGETVEVIERDDGFGDGWWRGRNQRGEEGLFPATYISEDPTEEETKPPKPANKPITSTDPILSEIPPVNSDPAQPTNSANHAKQPVGDGNVLGTTIGDVEHAIQSIAKPDSDDDAGYGVGQDTRARLAAQAKLANDNRDRQRTSGGVTGLIYSDESDDEEDLPHRTGVNGATKGDSKPRSTGSTAAPDERASHAGTESPQPISASASSSDQRVLQPALPLPSSPQSSGGMQKPGFLPNGPPSTWTVTEVVSWIRSKGMEDSICEKFQEHEISGDLLLDLDVNMLKELDIPQFGKRLRIAQAINELSHPNPISASLQRGMSAPPSALSAGANPAPLSPGLQGSSAENGWSGSDQGLRRSSAGTSMPPTPMAPIQETRAPTETAGSSVSTAVSMPSSPMTPSSSMTKRESTGSVGHKRGKGSIDGKDRLSFFNRGRKPAPATSPSDLRPARLMPSNRVHQIQPTTPEQGRRTSANLSGSALALRQIGPPDHSGYMKKKGERYGWKTRFFVLKGNHLYYMKSEQDDRVKGNIDVRGYRVIVDENANPGSYGFRLVGNERPHYFSSPEQLVIREWMKALIKATIARDYTVPVTSSCNIPTIPLSEAQAMSPRPPSPATRDATQRANRRADPNQLTAHDTSVLMSLDNSKRMSQTMPSRPSRDTRRPSNSVDPQAEQELLIWVNAKLPPQYPKASSLPQSFMSGEVIFLLLRHLSGIEPSPPVPPNVFLPENGMPNVDGLFAMMDMVIDSGVDTVGVSINDIRVGDGPAISRLVGSIRNWSDQKDRS